MMTRGSQHSERNCVSFHHIGNREAVYCKNDKKVPEEKTMKERLL
jgi:hypothetical protein